MSEPMGAIEVIKTAAIAVSIVVGLTHVFRGGLEFFKYRLDLSKAKAEAKEQKAQGIYMVYNNILNAANLMVYAQSEIEMRVKINHEAFNSFQENSFGMSVELRKFCLDLINRLNRAAAYDKSGPPKAEGAAEQNNEDINYILDLVRFDDEKGSNKLFDKLEAELS